MIIIAILIPWLSFFFRGKILAGIICLILQCTIIGWLPAAIWAVIARQDEIADRRIARIERRMN